MYVVLIALMLAGCQTIDGRETRYYSSAEIDSINAQMACRQMARNMLQLERCNVRR